MAGLRADKTAKMKEFSTVVRMDAIWVVYSVDYSVVLKGHLKETQLVDLWDCMMVVSLAESTVGRRAASTVG